MLTRELILEQIAPVEDPELGLGLVDLGLIYNVDIKENNDISRKFPEITENLKKLLENWRISIEAKIPEKNPNYVK